MSRIDDIIALVGYKRGDVKIAISSGIMLGSTGGNFIGMCCDGLYCGKTNTVTIDRSLLCTEKFAGFAGTLIHEFTHAIDKKMDVTRDFELVLTKHIGRLAARLIG